MNDEFDPFTHNDFGERQPWIVTRGGQVFLGPPGCVHDDLLADAMIDSDEVAGSGEIQGSGHIVQIKPLGTEFAAQVEEALDEDTAVKLGATKKPTRFTVTPEGLVSFLKPGEEIPQGAISGQITPVGKLYRIDGVDPALHHHVHRAWTQTLEPPHTKKKEGGITDATLPSARQAHGEGSTDWQQAESQPTYQVEVPGMASGLQPLLQGADVPAQSLREGFCADCQRPLDGEQAVCPHCLSPQQQVQEQAWKIGATSTPLPLPSACSPHSRRSSEEPQPHAPERSTGPLPSGRGHVRSSRTRSPSESSSLGGKAGRLAEEEWYVEDAEHHVFDGLGVDPHEAQQRAGQTRAEVARLHPEHEMDMPVLDAIGVKMAVEWNAGTLLDGHEHANDDSNSAGALQATNPNNHYWVYLDGQVAFDQYPWRAARTLAMKTHPNRVDYIANTIARNDIPNGIACAVGELLGNRPQIWLSNVDRNAVWDAVTRSLNEGAGPTDSAADSAGSTRNHTVALSRARTARTPQMYDGKLWGNIVFLVNPDGRFIVGAPTDHHPDAWQRETGEDAYSVPLPHGGWAPSPEFMAWAQYDLNFELDPQTGECTIHWPSGEFPQRAEIEQQARQNIAQWFAPRHNARTAALKCPYCGASGMTRYPSKGYSQCMSCKRTFEDDVLFGRKPLLQDPAPTGELWPDTLPWGDEEQDYYRTSATYPVQVEDDSDAQGGTINAYVNGQVAGSVQWGLDSGGQCVQVHNLMVGQQYTDSNVTMAILGKLVQVIPHLPIWTGTHYPGLARLLERYNSQFANAPKTEDMFFGDWGVKDPYGYKTDNFDPMKPYTMDRGDWSFTPKLGAYITEAEAREFGKNYIDSLARKIMGECTDTEIPDEGAEKNHDLFRLYAMLALTKGKDTTAEDVHDAWCAWMATIDSEHKSLKPFSDLTDEVKSYDEPYVKYIHKHAGVEHWSMPYHVSPSGNRQRIERDGLDTSYGDLYFWDTDDQARRYWDWLMQSHPQQSRVPADVWYAELTPEELAQRQTDEALHSDMQSHPPEGGLGSEWYTGPNGEFGAYSIPVADIYDEDNYKPLPPERMRRVDSAIKQHAYATVLDMYTTGYMSQRKSSRALRSRTRARIGGFYITAADVDQLAAEALQRLESRDDIAKILQRVKAEGVHNLDQNEYNVYAFLVHLNAGRGERAIQDEDAATPSETYKMWEWFVGQIKRGNVNYVGNAAHVQDILKQATKWMQWSQQQHQPVPDWKRKDFTFADMQNWVYQLNAKDNDENSQWENEKKIFSFPDGWYMAEVSAQDCGLEGELMGHCVGGYGHQILNGTSYIVSLRDPKGQPHVTLEMEGGRPEHYESDTQWGGKQTLREPWYVQQIQGKQDQRPIEQYRKYIRGWFDSLKEEGLNIRWADGAVIHNPEGYGYDEPIYLEDQSHHNEVKKLPHVLDALDAINEHGMGSYDEDKYLDESNWESADTTDPDYEIAGKIPQPTVIPANTISVGPGYQPGGQNNKPDADHLLDLWSEFIAKVAQGRITNEDEIRRYVQGFFFIPKANGDRGDWYGHPLDAHRRSNPEALGAWIDTAHKVMAEQPVLTVQQPQQPQLFDPGPAQPVANARGEALVNYAIQYMAALYQGYEQITPGTMRAPRHNTPAPQQYNQRDVRVQRPDPNNRQQPAPAWRNPRYYVNDIAGEIAPVVSPPWAQQMRYEDPWQIGRNPPNVQPKVITRMLNIPNRDAEHLDWLPSSASNYDLATNLPDTLRLGAAFATDWLHVAFAPAVPLPPAQPALVQPGAIQQAQPPAGVRSLQGLQRSRPARGYPNVTIVGGTPQQQMQVDAALRQGKLNWGILPAIRVVISNLGAQASDATPGVVNIDAHLLNSGQFAWGTIIHEMCHQIDFYLLTDDMRTQLLPLLGVQSWYGATHASSGLERFASSLAYALWPSQADSMAPQGGSGETVVSPQFLKTVMSLLPTLRTSSTSGLKLARSSAGMSHFGDYNGWTNWDTWHTALMMDNEQQSYTQAREFAEHGTLEQFRDWAIQTILGPHNRQDLQGAQEWNDMSPDERREMYPDADMDFDADDEPQMIMDEGKVNWQEIWDHLVEEVKENKRYEEEQAQKLRDNPPPPFVAPTPKYQVGQRVMIVHPSGANQDGIKPGTPATITQLPPPVEHAQYTLQTDDGQATTQWESSIAPIQTQSETGFHVGAEVIYRETPESPGVRVQIIDGPWEADRTDVVGTGALWRIAPLDPAVKQQWYARNARQEMLSLPGAINPAQDQTPTNFTLNDLGIPPEGEDYYRTSMQHWGSADPFELMRLMDNGETIFGRGLKPDIRARVLAFFEQPSPDAWADIRGIIISPPLGSIWQAVAKLAPEYGRYDSASLTPDPQLVMAALQDELNTTMPDHWGGMPTICSHCGQLLGVNAHCPLCNKVNQIQKEPSIEDMGDRLEIPASDQYPFPEPGNDYRWSRMRDDEQSSDERAAETREQRHEVAMDNGVHQSHYREADDRSDQNVSQDDHGWQSTAKTAELAQRYYHGTNVQLGPGETLTPRPQDRPPNYPNVEYAADVVYLSTQPHLAERYAVGVAGRYGGEPHVYEVVAQDVQPDPEQETGWSTDQLIAPSAQIVREIDLPGHAHWNPEGFMMRGPAPATPNLDIESAWRQSRSITAPSGVPAAPEHSTQPYSPIGESHAVRAAERRLKNKARETTSAVDPKLWEVVMRGLHRMNELYRPGEVTEEALMNRIVTEVMDAYPPNARPSNTEISNAASFAVQMWNQAKGEDSTNTLRYVKRNADPALPYDGMSAEWGTPFNNYWGDPRYKGMQRENSTKHAGDPANWQSKYNYRKSSGFKDCGSCAAFIKGRCDMFKAKVEAEMVCSEWTDEWPKKHQGATITSMAERTATIHEVESELDPNSESVWRPGYLFLHSGNVYLGPEGTDHYNLDIPWEHEHELAGRPPITPYAKINIYNKPDPYAPNVPLGVHVAEDSMGDLPEGVDEWPPDLTAADLTPHLGTLNQLGSPVYFHPVDGTSPQRLAMVKTAMAERTGDPQLDALIEEFTNHEMPWMDDEETLPINTMRSPLEAEGMCGEITTAFQAFVWDATKGAIYPENVEMTDGSFNAHSPSFDQMGYGDRKPGEPGHLVSKIEMPSGTYLIDWTASQYGYTEFPMVQKLDGDQWQREWTAAAAPTFGFPEREVDGLPALGVQAFMGRDQVGYLYVWTNHQVVASVWVEPGLRRQGVATQMLDAFVQHYGFRPTHNWQDMSADGKQWAKKVGMAPQVMYHRSPRSQRDSILQHGIDHRIHHGDVPFPQDTDDVSWAPRGNYLSETLDHPSAFLPDTDVWEVNVNGLDLAPDDAWYRGHYTTQPINPERLRLVDQRTAAIKTGVDNPVERWVQSGKVMPYRSLSPEYQKAIAHYMAVDGEAWEGPSSLYPERTDYDAPYVTPRVTDEHLPHFIEHYGDTPFGVTHVPLDELKQAVSAGDFDAWHREFEQGLTGGTGMTDRGVPEDGQEIWPVALDRDYGDVLQDGWHRLHNYATRGINPVPAFFYPREGDGEAYQSAQEPRREARSPQEAVQAASATFGAATEWDTHPEEWSPIKIEQAESTPEFHMPLQVEQRFVDARECPECKGRLADRDGSGVQCTYCGWRPRISTL